MKLGFCALLFTITTRLIAQDKAVFDPNKQYHPDSLKRWTTSIMGELSRKHPGFYRYTTKKRFDFLIDSTTQTIHEPLTEVAYYRKMKPLVGYIRCLHTGVSLSKEFNNYLAKTSTLLPLEVFINDGKTVWVTKNHSTNSSIPIRGEILSINERPIGEILKTLFKAIPSDGYNETEKIILLNHRFAFWYQTMIEITEDFKVRIKLAEDVETYEMKGVGKEMFPTMESLETAREKQLVFEVRNNVGLLTVHSFARSIIKGNDQDFKKFLKTTFKALETNQVKTLVIDLRYNSGGTDGNAALLASYFFDKPFRYWGKIEVTAAIAKEIKGFNRLFYKKSVRQDSIYLWKKTWLTHEFDYYEIQKPAKHNFEGRVYLLTNGLCMSSCGDFVAILSQNKKAKVIGQECGGGFQGNTSGMIPSTKIPSGLSISVPLQKYTNAVDHNKNPGRGTVPDYQVSPTLDEWINKTDVEMTFALKLIKEN